MRLPPLSLLLIFALLTASPRVHAQKDVLDAAVKVHTPAAWDMARKIWDWAEPGY